MRREALEAPEVVARLIARNLGPVRDLCARLRADPPRLVATCARGSSDHAATYARYLIETRLGLSTTSISPSVSSLYAESAAGEGTLFLAISQSGRSPDLLAATKAAKARGARIVALVNDEQSPLFALADHALPLCAGPERAVAATKSFIASLAAVLQLVALWTGKAELAGALVRLPSDLSDAAGRDWSPMAEAFRPASSLFVLGRGPGLGVAAEMALKLKETASIHAEAFSSAEMQHGPMTLVKPGFPVLAIGQRDAALASVAEAAALLAGRGAKVLTAGFSVPGGIELPTRAADPAVEPILFAQSFYPAASDLSVMRGLNPDAPPHLSKVTETL